MVKKIIAVATAILMLCCMVPLAAFADDVLDTCPKCGERTYETWQDFSTSVPDLGFPISIKRRHCTSCQYTYYDWNCMGYTGYKEFDSGSGNLIADYLKEWKDKTFGKNATAKQYETGGGSAGTGGVGRNPSGYSENNTPNVTQAGVLHFYAPVTGWDGVSSGSYTASFSASNPTIKYCVASANATGSQFPADWTGGGNRYVRVICAFTAPVSGTYWVNKGDKVAVYRYVYNGSWRISNLTVSSSVSRD